MTTNNIIIYKQKFLKEKPEWCTKYKGTTGDLSNIVLEKYLEAETLKGLAENMLNILDDIKESGGKFTINYDKLKKTEVHENRLTKIRSLNFLERKLFEYHINKALDKRVKENTASNQKP